MERDTDIYNNYYVIYYIFIGHQSSNLSVTPFGTNDLDKPKDNDIYGQSSRAKPLTPAETFDI